MNWNVCAITGSEMTNDYHRPFDPRADAHLGGGKWHQKGVLLHDERAMQAQQRCGWSCGHPQSSFNRSEQGQRRHVGERREREDGHQHGRWQVQVRLSDRQQRVLLSAGAIVIVFMARPAGRRVQIDAFFGGGCVMVGFVIVSVPIRMLMGDRLDRGVRRRGITRFARGQPHA